VPEIIVRTSAASRQDGVILLRERINVADFKSNHFTAQLIERLRWAVGDADAAEQARRDAEDRDRPTHSRPPIRLEAGCHDVGRAEREAPAP
jgi:hypothetical protein